MTPSSDQSVVECACSWASVARIRRRRPATSRREWPPSRSRWRPEARDAKTERGDFTIAHGTKHTVVSEFLHAPPEGSVAPFGTAMQCNVQAEKIITGEHIADEFSSARNLASVLPQ